MVRNMIKFSRRKARKNHITSLAICLVLVNLLLNNMSSKNLVVFVLTNLPNT